MPTILSNSPPESAPPRQDGIRRTVTDSEESRARSRTNWALLGFLIVAGYFLLTEHQAHVVKYLPFVLLLLCPLMHLFHGHGAHHGKSGNDTHAASNKEHRHA